MKLLVTTVWSSTSMNTSPPASREIRTRLVPDGGRQDRDAHRQGHVATGRLPHDPAADAQHIANHESPRATKLYDRRQDEISLHEVERIAI
jgi:hypothetical protein